MSREALESLKLEMTSMEVEKSALRTELYSAQEEITQLKQNLKDSESAVETKKAELKGLEESLEAEKAENLKKATDISNLESCTESLKEDLKNSQAEVKSMVEKADTDRVAIADLNGKLEAKEAELVQSLDALEQDLSDLSKVCKISFSIPESFCTFFVVFKQTHCNLLSAISFYRKEML